MITVVHIITKLELGGAQENTIYTCKNLDRSRFAVWLIHGPGGLLDDEVKNLAGIEVRVIDDLVREIDPVKDARCLTALTKELKARVRSDPSTIVHTHSSKAGVLGRLAAKAAGVKTVVHTIHGFGFYEGQPRLSFEAFLNAERAMAPLTTGFISVSRASLAEARARGIISGNHEVEVIRSGFDLSEFSRPDPGKIKELRASLGIADDAEIVLSVANMKPQKDPATMVRAAKYLLAKRPGVVFLFAGDGPLRREVEELITELGLSERFLLLGWRRDIPELMHAADVVALSSRFEGLPRAAVQALCAKKPFVGTRVDGTTEIIRDGKNGYLVEPQSPEALAEALEKALDERPVDAEDQTRLTEWDQNEMVRRQEAFYLRLQKEGPT